MRFAIKLDAQCYMRTFDKLQELWDAIRYCYIVQVNKQNPREKINVFTVL